MDSGSVSPGWAGPGVMISHRGEASYLQGNAGLQGSLAILSLLLPQGLCTCCFLPGAPCLSSSPGSLLHCVMSQRV